MSKSISEKVLFFSIFLILFGGIFASKALGIWTVEAKAKLIKYDALDAYKPDDIRGSFSFEDVSTYYDVPVEALLKAFKYPLDTDPSTVSGKDFEERFAAYHTETLELGNGSIKQFVAIYQDLPYTLDETALFPAEALEVLSNHRSLDTETLNYLNAHIVEVDLSKVYDPSESEMIEESTAITDEEPIIKGATTFTQLIDMGIDQSAIEKIIGAPIEQKNQVIRDYCVANDLSFSEIKIELEALFNQ